MRVSASLGLVVFLALFAACQQRNYARCLPTNADFQCESGKFCQPDPIDPTNGVGTCVDSQCTVGESPSRCSGTTPLCSLGRCVGCTNSMQCAGLGTAQPVCLIDTAAGKTEGSCVACAVDTDCISSANAYTTKPVCDKVAHTCRTCALHSECSTAISGKVCAKDDTLASLPVPITKGMCAPANRVLVVDDSTCTANCSLQSQVTFANTDKPYVLVKKYDGTNGQTITISPSSLAEQHIISGSADLSPPQLKTAGFTAMLQGSGGSAAVTVNAGASVTIEGFALHDTGPSPTLLCNGNGTMATSVKLLRSIITGGALGIKASALCQLTLDQSWIGALPDQYRNGNDVAMTLDSTQFEIVNTVFNHNLRNGNFGGITLTDTGKPGTLQGRIVNSTFYRQESLDAIGAMAVYCPAALTKPVLVFNTLFVNSAAFTNPSGKPYVHPNCYKGVGALGYYGTDENPIPNDPGVVSGISDSIFTSAATSVLSLLATSPTPKALITGGVKTYPSPPSPLSGAAPTVDIIGAPRGMSSVSIGAYEVAH